MAGLTGVYINDIIVYTVLTLVVPYSSSSSVSTAVKDVNKVVIFGAATHYIVAGIGRAV